MSKKKQETNITQSDTMVSLENLDQNKQDSVSSIQKNKKTNSKTKELENLEQVIEKSEEEFENQLIEERLESAKQVENPKKKIKSSIINTLFLLVNIALMVFIVKSFLDSFEDGMDLNAILSAQGNKLWWLAVGLVLYLVFIFTESGIFTSLIKGTVGKHKFYTSYRVAITGKYYDNITPFSIGGQPFQIILLSRAGMSPGISTSLPVIKVIIYNIVYTIMITLCFLLGIPLITPELTGLGRFLMILLIAVGILGLIFTALSSLLFVLIGNGKIIGRGVARWAIKIGYSLRIVKNYRKSYNKIMLQVREYQNSINFLKSNVWVMIKCIICSIIQIFAYFSIPVVCILAFGTGLEFSLEFWFVCFTKFLICQMAAVIIPLPGGTGMLEVGFILAFGTASVLGDNVVWALLAFRIITYYLLLAHGFTQTVIDSVVRSVRERRNTKKLQKSTAIE